MYVTEVFNVFAKIYQYVSLKIQILRYIHYPLSKTNINTVEIDIFQKGVVKHQSIAKREFSLRPGDYYLNITNPAKGAELERSKVTIERGKTEKIKVLLSR